MQCPCCQGDNDRVADSKDCGKFVRRRRACKRCRARWNTKEVPAELLDRLLEALSRSVEAEEARRSTSSVFREVKTELIGLLGE